MSEFPKWVIPHDSQLHRIGAEIKSVVDEVTGAVRQVAIGGHVSSPHWPAVHVARDGVATVLVEDAAQEAKAQADVTPKAEPEPPAETEPPPPL